MRACHGRMDVHTAYVDMFCQFVIYEMQEMIQNMNKENKKIG